MMRLAARCIRARRFGLACALFALLALAPHVSLAQSSGDLAAGLVEWSQTAERAEQALQSGLASSAAFETLRDELAGQRAAAEKAINSGSILVRSLKAQLDVLGPAPKKDESEPERIASQRQQLADALSAAEAPVIGARQAFARANVLIEEIDALVRGREASDLLAQSPSPLLPSSWSSTASDVAAYSNAIAIDLRKTIELRGGMGQYVESQVLPALGKALLALIVPFGIGHLVLRLLERRVAGGRRSARYVLNVVAIHVLRLLFTTVGAVLLTGSIIDIAVARNTTENLTATIVGAAVILVIANWLGNILFAPAQREIRLVGLDDRLARTSYHLCLAFGVAVSLEMLIEGAGEDFAFNPATKSVLTGLVVVLGSVVLFGLARVLLSSLDTGDRPRAVAGDECEPADDDPAGTGFLAFLARSMQFAAILAVVSGAIGYVPLAQQVLTPMILSLGIFGLAYVIHHAAIGAVRLFFGDERASSSLLPITVAVILVLTCIPALALIWGARFSDISETWRLLSNGFDIGGTRISLKVFVVLLVAFLVSLFVTRWLQRIVTSVVLPKTRIDAGGRNAISTGMGYVGVILSVLIAISAAGLDLSNLAIIAGALSVGVGFGMQAIISNFVSGIILLIERPIKEGDWIEVSGHSGIVRKIAVRSTRLETFDRHDVIIPNSDLIAGSVINMTLSSQTGRLIIPVGIAYRSDLERTKQILLEAAAGNADLLSYPPPQVFFIRLGESSIDLELRCFLHDVGTIVKTRSDLLFAIYAAFEQNHIEIPYPQRDVNLRNVGELMEGLLWVKRQQTAEGQGALAGPAPAAEAGKDTKD